MGGIKETKKLKKKKIDRPTERLSFKHFMNGVLNILYHDAHFTTARASIECCGASKRKSKTL